MKAAWEHRASARLSFFPFPWRPLRACLGVTEAEAPADVARLLKDRNLTAVRINATKAKARGSRVWSAPRKLDDLK
jgi:hypothetical protein